jgi:hypothetical protein
MQISGSETRVVNCYVGNSGSDGIQLAYGGNNCVVVGCMVQDNAAGASIDVTVSAEDNVVVGNRTDGAPSDASGTSTVASNESTAF